MDVAAKHAIVPTLEQNAVIVYLSSNVNASVKMLLSLRSVQLKSKCFACHTYILTLESKYLKECYIAINVWMRPLLLRLTKTILGPSGQRPYIPALKDGDIRALW
jgi:hypothetical protein